MRKVRVGAAVLLAAGLSLAFGCRAPVRPYECAVPRADVDVDPHQVWRCHREIAVRVVRGREFSLREFDRAATFFEELTGIRADSLQTDLGRVPGKAMRESLRGWDAWYEENGSRLEWDRAERRVVIRP